MKDSIKIKILLYNLKRSSSTQKYEVGLYTTFWTYLFFICDQRFIFVILHILFHNRATIWPNLRNETKVLKELVRLFKCHVNCNNPVYCWFRFVFLAKQQMTPFLQILTNNLKNRRFSWIFSDMLKWNLIRKTYPEKKSSQTQLDNKFFKNIKSLSYSSCYCRPQTDRVIQNSHTCSSSSEHCGYTIWIKSCMYAVVYSSSQTSCSDVARIPPRGLSSTILTMWGICSLKSEMHSISNT